MQQHLDVGVGPVEAFLLVADVLDRLAGEVLDHGHRDSARTTVLASDDDAVGGGQRLAGGADDPRVEAFLQALTEERVHHLVGDTIANLVRMPF